MLAEVKQTVVLLKPFELFRRYFGVRGWSSTKYGAPGTRVGGRVASITLWKPSATQRDFSVKRGASWKRGKGFYNSGWSA